MITLNVGCSGTVNWIQAKTNLLPRFPSGARYLIGVSGGRDSVVLLDALVDLDYRKLIVCHFDHQLRGRSSRADARFVEKLAAKYDVDLEIGSADVRAVANHRKMSIETAARGCVIRSLRKWRSKGAVRRFFSLITPTIWSRRF